MPAVLARLRSSPPAHEANADSRNAGHEDHDAEEPVEAGLATVPVLDSEPQDVKGRISAVPSPPFSSLIPSSAIRTRRGGATPRRAGNGSISTLHARGFELPDETLEGVDELLRTRKITRSLEAPLVLHSHARRSATIE